MILKTDAVVLQTRRFRESSKIVTLYTREHGKLTAIARGAMQAKSKFGSTLQPMALLSTVIYRKEGRDLQNLSGAEPLRRFARLGENLERMSAGLTIVELVNATMHDEDRHDDLFEALVAALQALDDTGSDESVVVLWFMTRLADLLGYAVQTDQCGICQETVPVSDGDVAYSLSMGAPLCSEHRESVGYRAMDQGTFELLRNICASDADSIGRLQAEQRAGTALRDSLMAFIRYHVEGIRRLNVADVAGKILGRPPVAR